MSIIIGIDPGVNTGLAIWDTEGQKFLELKSMKIHQALELILKWRNIGTLLVRVEDARMMRTGRGQRARDEAEFGGGVREGVGSVKRDCTIWEDFFKDKGILYEMVHPKQVTRKLTAEQFKRTTGWTGVTNNHARDAGMLVFGFTERNLQFYLKTK